MEKLALLMRSSLLELKLDEKSYLDKARLMGELLTESNAFLELQWANTIAEQSEKLAGVHQVSRMYLDHLRANTDAVIMLLDSPAGEKIKQELLDKKFFGRFLDLETVNLSSQTLLVLILEALENPKYPLDQIMQLHCVLGYRVLKLILPELSPKFAELWSNLSPVLKDRGRLSSVEKDKKIEKTVWSQQTGFNTCAFFVHRSQELSYQWSHGGEVHQKDLNSPFVQELELFHLPFVSGPSGHTLGLMIAAQVFGNLSDLDFIRDYALACFSFLARGGHHSFHEVMMIGRLFGVDYQTGSYESVAACC